MPNLRVGQNQLVYPHSNIQQRCLTTLLEAVALTERWVLLQSSSQGSFGNTFVANLLRAGREVEIAKPLSYISGNFNDTSQVFIDAKEQTIYFILYIDDLHIKRFASKFARQRTLHTMCLEDIIDEKIIRSDVTEFYVLAHNPLKEMSRISQYAVLVNELKILLTRLERK